MSSSKIYIIDSAFKYAMTIGEDTGRLLENAVFLFLNQRDLNVYYLKNKQEVDFYWENGMPVNVCYELYDYQTKKREVSGMIEALNSLNKPEGIILTRDHEEIIKVNNKFIKIMPAWKYFFHK